MKKTKDSIIADNEQDAMISYLTNNIDKFVSKLGESSITKKDVYNYLNRKVTPAKWKKIIDPAISFAIKSLDDKNSIVKNVKSFKIDLDRALIYMLSILGVAIFVSIVLALV
jgi:hypothetical protein